MELEWMGFRSGVEAHRRDESVVRSSPKPALKHGTDRKAQTNGSRSKIWPGGRPVRIGNARQTARSPHAHEGRYRLALIRICVFFLSALDKNHIT